MSKEMISEQINITRQIYESLGDELSREIYINRIMYSLTNDNYYIDELIRYTSSMQWLKKQLEGVQSKQVFLYGAGYRGLRIAKYFKEYFTGVIDQDKSKNNTYIEGLKVQNLEKTIKEYGLNIIVVISVSVGSQEIEKNLIALGINRGYILNVEYKINDMIKRQYFDLVELTKDNEEVFVDCGAYDGYTAIEFSKWADGKFKRIYCFEPDLQNLQKCKENLERMMIINKCELIDKGTWSERTELKFSKTEDESSHVCDEGDDVVLVTSIDEELKAVDKVSFIKMDIEGAELESLFGAKKIICRDHPKLAICVYHRAEDIFTIPQYIMSLWGNYKLYLRHYTFAEWDTVLYAIPNDK